MSNSRRGQSRWLPFILALAALLVIAACARPQRPTSITLNPTEATLEVGETLRVSATVRSPAGIMLGAPISWASSNTDVATVDSDGVIAALATGSATITADAGNNVSATVSLTVIEAVDGIVSLSIDPASLELVVGGDAADATGTLTVTATHESGDTSTPEDVVWSSSDDDVAEVDDGLVTAVAVGTATITAQVGEVSATAQVTVTQAVEPEDPVTGITVTPATATLVLGGGASASVTLTVTLIHESGDTSTPESVAWTSDDEPVATVDSNGTVTAQGVGTAEITAVAAGFSATAVITVTDGIIGLELDRDAVTLVLASGDDESHQFTASFILASGGTEPATGVEWSSSAAGVAAVDGNGLATAVDKGTAVVTATAAGFSATADVVVEDAIVGLRIDPDPVPDLSVSVPQETIELEAWYMWASPTTADTPAADVTWSSSDNNVVTVDADGLVTAIGMGTATVTAESDSHDLDASVSISVDDPVTALVLDSVGPALVQTGPEEYEVTLAVGDATDETVTVELALLRASGTLVPVAATAADIISDPANPSGILDVDLGSLTLTAVGAGEVEFTFTVQEGSTDFSATLTVTVLDPIVGVTITPTSATLDWSDPDALEQQFIASYEHASGLASPAPAVAWSVTGAASLAIDADDGLLILVGTGSADTETGTVTATDTGLSLSANATVTVLNPVVDIIIREGATPLVPATCSLSLVFGTNPTTSLQAWFAYASNLEATPTDVTVAWSTDPATDAAITFATLPDGEVTVSAAHEGSADLTASASPAGTPLQATITVCVIDPDTEELVLSPAPADPALLTFEVGEDAPEVAHLVQLQRESGTPRSLDAAEALTLAWDDTHGDNAIDAVFSHNGTDAVVTFTALRAGTASAAVTSDAGPFSAPVAFTVDDPLVAIDLAPALLSLVAGGTDTIAATPTWASGTNVYPVTLLWASDNADVATVTQGGEVTAVAAGSAGITASVGTVQGHASVEVFADFDPDHVYVGPQNPEPGVAPRGTQANPFENVTEALAYPGVSLTALIDVAEGTYVEPGTLTLNGHSIVGQSTFGATTISIVNAMSCSGIVLGGDGSELSGFLLDFAGIGTTVNCSDTLLAGIQVAGTNDHVIDGVWLRGRDVAPAAAAESALVGLRLYQSSGTEVRNVTVQFTQRDGIQVLGSDPRIENATFIQAAQHTSDFGGLALYANAGSGPTSAVLAGTWTFHMPTNAGIIAGSQGGETVTLALHLDPDPDPGSVFTVGTPAAIPLAILSGLSDVVFDLEDVLAAFGSTVVIDTGTLDFALVLDEPDDALEAALFLMQATFAGPGTVVVQGLTPTLTADRVLVARNEHIEMSIAAALNVAAETGAVNGVHVREGVYNQRVIIDESVDLTGAGAGLTVIRGSLLSDNAIPGGTLFVDWLNASATGAYNMASGTGISITAPDVTVSDLTVQEFKDGIVIDAVDATLSNVVVTDTWIGVQVKPGGTADGLTINGGQINNSILGLYSAHPSASELTSFSNVTVDGTTFDYNTAKAIYLEAFDDSALLNVTVTNSGNYGGQPGGGIVGLWGAGIDINLKFDDYADILLDNVTVENSGASDRHGLEASSHPGGAAVTIKARDDGSYTTNPASLSGLVIVDSTIEGGYAGLRLGEYNSVNSTPTGFSLSDTALAGDEFTLMNFTTEDIDATGGVTFNGLDPETADPFAVAATLWHRPDNAALGLITFVSGSDDIFVPVGKSVQGALDIAGVGQNVLLEAGEHVIPATLLVAGKTLVGSDTDDSIIRVDPAGLVCYGISLTADGATLASFTLDVTGLSLVSEGCESALPAGIAADGTNDHLIDGVTVHGLVVGDTTASEDSNVIGIRLYDGSGTTLRDVTVENVHRDGIQVRATDILLDGITVRNAGQHRTGFGAVAFYANLATGPVSATLAGEWLLEDLGGPFGVIASSEDLQPVDLDVAAGFEADVDEGPGQATLAVLRGAAFIPLDAIAPALITGLGLSHMTLDPTAPDFLFGFQSVENAIDAALLAVALGSTQVLTLEFGDDLVAFSDSSFVVGSNATDEMNIQTAVDFAILVGNDGVRIRPGEYPQHVAVTGSVVITGEDQADTVILAPATMVGVNGQNHYPVIHVTGPGTQAEISNLTVSGPFGSMSDCLAFGILVSHDAELELSDATLDILRQEPLSGCQGGHALRVGWGAEGYGGSASLTDVTITDFQKGGIVVDGAGSHIDIDGAVITGTPTPVTAQNGIQISRGATSNITGAVLSDIFYTGATWGASAILFFEQDGDVVLDGNTITNSQLGVAIQDLAATPGNHVVSNNDFENNSAHIVTYIAGSTVDATIGNVFNTVSVGSATLADLFDIERNIFHAVDNASYGLVRLVADTLYVTADNLIQNGIDAASDGDTIHIEAGTYDAGFVIVDRDGLTLVGAGAGDTTVAPAAAIASGTGHKYTANMNVAAFIDGSTDISLEAMTIGTGGLNWNSQLDAIVFWNASTGALRDLHIDGSATATINGAQTGQGLAVSASAGEATVLDIVDTDFTHWQKNAIDIVDGNGAETGGGNIAVTVTGGVFTGRGPTSVTAQNGIMYWGRAGGTVTGSIDGAAISGVSFTPDGTSASAILVFGGAAVSTISNTTFAAVERYVGNTSPTDIDARTGNVFDGTAQPLELVVELPFVRSRILDKETNPAYGWVFVH